MNADGKSDGPVVPSTQTNNTGTEPVAESAEGRDSPAERNVEPSDLPRSPKRKRNRSLGLAGVRETARAQPELKFTSLLHHVNEQLLYEAFFALKKDAAVGYAFNVSDTSSDGVRLGARCRSIPVTQ